MSRARTRAKTTPHNQKAPGIRSYLVRLHHYCINSTSIEHTHQLSGGEITDAINHLGKERKFKPNVKIKKVSRNPYLAILRHRRYQRYVRTWPHIHLSAKTARAKTAAAAAAAKTVKQRTVCLGGALVERVSQASIENATRWAMERYSRIGQQKDRAEDKRHILNQKRP